MKTLIKEYRASHNLTQERLAEIVGVRRETIIFLEQGKYIILLCGLHTRYPEP
jgi:putative transcriptional regulator